MATYEDAVRLEEIVNAILEGEPESPEADNEYKEIIQRLVTENDEEVAQLAVRLHLSPSLEKLSAETRSRRDNMLTSTAFTKAMRRIKDILMARKRRDDRLIRKGDESSARPFAAEHAVLASTWTGASTPLERLTSVRTLLPIAQGAIEQLILSLEAHHHNGGPLLDERRDAIDNLRSLHLALGQLLVAADEGRLAEEYHEGLVAEAVRYGKRAARSLQSDPVPYALAGTVLAIMCACGFPTAGGFLADLAFSIRRPSAS